MITLLADGAQFEDIPWWRVRNHFYNPRTTKGLSKIFVPSPDWALEDRGTDDSQSYSLRWAQTYLRLALSQPTPEERRINFGNTFRTLGQVIHHVQDMAQPQHTRDDWHLPFTEAAAYEKWTKERFPTEGTFRSKYGDTSYPAPNFPTARAFWDTSMEPDGHGGSLPSRQGMAEFAHYNFVTYGTNFSYLGPPSSGGFPDLNLTVAKPGFSEPDPRTGTILEMDLDDLAQSGAPPQVIARLRQLGGGAFYFVRTLVTDGLTGDTQENAFTSTFSVFAADLQHYNLCQGTPCQMFSLNSFNFDAANDLLLRRAIGYSAGLINHFFRGVINPDGSPALRLHAAGLGSEQGVLTVRNVSGEDFSGGSLEVYYDDRTDGRRTSAGILRTVVIPAGGAVDISRVGRGIDFAALWKHGPVDEGSIVVVYTGRIGDEPGGVAARVCECPGVTVSDPADPANDCTSLCPCGASPMGGLQAPIRLHRDGGCYAMGNDHILVTADETRNWLTLTPSIAPNPDAEVTYWDTDIGPGVADGPFWADSYPAGAECLLPGNDQGIVTLKYRVLLMQDDPRVLDDTEVLTDVRQWTSDNGYQDGWWNWGTGRTQIYWTSETLGALRSQGAVDGMITLAPLYFDPYFMITRGFGPVFSLPVHGPGVVCGEPVCGVPEDSGLTVRICNIEMSQE